MKLHEWDQVLKEQLSPRLARQAIHTANMTLARIYVAKGAVVPRHSHENEQVTVLLTGRLRFAFDTGDRVVEAGQMMEIPPNVPHSVEGLEDSVAMDLFAPRREDWIRGDDAYLRR